ncbi:ABC transporter ATP-binding protein / permease protein [[Mycoplasma] cavipharyngis]|uniref:ATP-binding cassette domain-containing protein n=1 Tax=[Mycoplasma] cavipharyngis TaxID=92757 RepID=UPI003704C5EE
MKLIWKHAKFSFLLFLLAVVFIDILEITISALLSIIISYLDQFVNQSFNNTNQFYYQILYYSLITIIVIVFNWFFWVGGYKLENRFKIIVIKKLEEQFLSANQLFFSSYEPTKPFLLVQRNASQIYDNVIRSFASLSGLIISLIFVVLLSTFVFDPLVLVFLGALILVSALPLISLTKTKAKQTELSNKAENNLYSKLDNLLEGYSRLYFENKQKLIIEKITNEVADNFKKKRTLFNTGSIIDFILEKSLIFVSISAEIIIAYLVINQQLKIATFIFFLTTFPQFANYVPRFFSYVSSIKSTKPVIAELDLNLVQDQNPIFNEVIQQIKITNLNLELANKPIFKNFNYLFEKGKKYAIVGPSGVGKSTLLKIIMGLNLDYQGSVKINNTEIKKINDAFLRNQLTYLSSEPFIYKDTIFNNVVLDQTKDQNSFVNALISVNLVNEINQKDYDNTDFDVESSLSLGQKQRINLSRIFFHQKNFLLLDEALSNLDKKNANLILNNLLNDKNKTVIYVSHHLDEAQKKSFDQVLEL